MADCAWAYPNGEVCTMSAYQGEPYCYQHLRAYAEADFERVNTPREWAAIKILIAQQVIDERTREANGIES